MTLIVENGTIVSGAESYTSVTYADLYHSNRGNTAWAALQTAAKEAALRKATDYMLQKYREQWQGYRVSELQSLDWPRQYVYIDRGNQIVSYLISETVVPAEVQNACCELALKSVSGELFADQTQTVVSKSVGPISVTYDKNSLQSIQYKAIDAMLQPYLIGKTGITAGVIRT
jgi:hypothetical protein